MKKAINITLVCILSILFVHTVKAQPTITFQVNLKPQLKDSVFIPGRDVAKLTGNIRPLSGRGLTLKDTAPKDSIYTVEVKFPGSTSGKKLSYNFVLNTAGKTIEESMPRLLDLRSGTYKLDALYFDSFAW